MNEPDVAEILLRFHGMEEPCNFFGMDEYADNEWCEEHCGNCSAKECWENAIRLRWYDKIVERYMTED